MLHCGIDAITFQLSCLFRRAKKGSSPNDLFREKVFFHAYLAFFEPPAEVLLLAKPYFFWYRLVILILPLTSFMMDMVFADGDELLSGLANGIQTASNIACSLLLVRHFGIAGIGMASLIGTLLLKDFEEGMAVGFFEFAANRCTFVIGNE